MNKYDVACVLFHFLRQKFLEPGVNHSTNIIYGSIKRHGFDDVFTEIGAGISVFLSFKKLSQVY